MANHHDIEASNVTEPSTMDATHALTDVNENDCNASVDVPHHASQLTMKRKQADIEEVLTSASSGDTDNSVTEVEYAVIEQNSKRRKIEIRKKSKGRCVADNVENLPPKPPVPPKPKHLLCRPPVNLPHNAQVKTVQKLTAHAEQLRQENTELRAALNAERNAVRTLR